SFSATRSLPLLILSPVALLRSRRGHMGEAATGRAPGAALSSLLGDDAPAWWSGAVVPHVASGVAAALAVAREQSTREAVNPSKVRW
ncbi:unnamed protein product, partial [Urochloa humidicola]